MRLVLDYETRSELNVQKVGAITYAQHESTEIMCVGYKIDDSPPRIWAPSGRGDRIPSELRYALNTDGSTNIVAHNALFEHCITEWVLRRKYIGKLAPVFPYRWKCTAAKAAACAIPRKLEKALPALSLGVSKDMEGHRLMLKHTKPRTAFLKRGTGTKYFEDPDERKRIYSYCLKDVVGEDLLDKALPDLSPYEQQVWEKNIKSNIRGVRVDIPTARRIIDWINEETKIQTKELRKLTHNRVETANQRDRLLNWINKQGFPLPNLQAETITKVLNPEGEFDPPPIVRRALEIRQNIGKSALKKYPAMVKRVSIDGRIKDYSMYHGAGTGRESGKGLQLQNLVKSKWPGFDPNLAIELINSSTPDEIKFLYGDLFEVLSGCVRSMVMASGHHKLYVADYNAIEARVVAWMAGQDDALNRFRRKIDSYVLMASLIYGVDVKDVTSEQRDIGKRVILGCGFGMGDRKFKATCEKYGIEITEELAKRAVKIYRRQHPQIEAMWGKVEKAAIMAVRRPGRSVTVCRTKWKKEGDFLWGILPSGRRLAFYKPTVKAEATPWGEMAPKLYHWDSVGSGKTWMKISTYGGKLTENVVQATARDIMINATMKLEDEGYSYLFQVHDEVISESMKGSVEEYERVMLNLPRWAKGLPLTAKGWSGDRYKKG